MSDDFQSPRRYSRKKTSTNSEHPPLELSQPFQVLSDLSDIEEGQDIPAGCPNVSGMTGGCQEKQQARQYQPDKRLKPQEQLGRILKVTNSRKRTNRLPKLTQRRQVTQRAPRGRPRRGKITGDKEASVSASTREISPENSSLGLTKDQADDYKQAFNGARRFTNMDATNFLELAEALDRPMLAPDNEPKDKRPTHLEHESYNDYAEQIPPEGWNPVLEENYVNNIFLEYYGHFVLGAWTIFQHTSSDAEIHVSKLMAIVNLLPQILIGSGHKVLSGVSDLLVNVAVYIHSLKKVPKEDQQKPVTVAFVNFMDLLQETAYYLQQKNLLTTDALASFSQSAVAQRLSDSLSRFSEGIGIPSSSRKDLCAAILRELTETVKFSSFTEKKRQILLLGITQAVVGVQTTEDTTDNTTEDEPRKQKANVMTRLLLSLPRASYNYLHELGIFTNRVATRVSHSDTVIASLIRPDDTEDHPEFFGLQLTEEILEVAERDVVNLHEERARQALEEQRLQKLAQEEQRKLQEERRKELQQTTEDLEGALTHEPTQMQETTVNNEPWLPENSNDLLQQGSDVPIEAEESSDQQNLFPGSAESSSSDGYELIISLRTKKSIRSYRLIPEERESFNKTLREAITALDKVQLRTGSTTTKSKVPRHAATSSSDSEESLPNLSEVPEEGLRRTSHRVLKRRGSSQIASTSTPKSFRRLGKADASRASPENTVMATPNQDENEQSEGNEPNDITYLEPPTPAICPETPDKKPTLKRWPIVNTVKTTLRHIGSPVYCKDGPEKEMYTQLLAADNQARAEHHEIDVVARSETIHMDRRARLHLSSYARKSSDECQITSR